ncbi:prepilin peptidase [Lactiplantibacillus garii]|uniref:Prepilin peptidase n=2 Tax=Lactiplantibacillus garii TaxID=2306423 RepID=A0A426DAS2_9LACO|nr:prepilin peptidase [Lactiplantibacillus garii]
MAERTCAARPLLNRQRSVCPTCLRQLRWWQLLPLIGVLIQRGRCWDCHHPINLRSSYVELLCGTLALTSFPQPNLALLCGYAVLFFNSLTDTLQFTVYPITLLPPALLGLMGGFPFPDMPLVILGGLLLGLFLLARYSAKFGMGDVDVLLMLSCLAPPVTVITSLTLAAFAALVTFSLDRRSARRLPFVPFMTWGFVLCTQFGN